MSCRLAVELRHGYVAWVPTTWFLRSSGHFNTDPAPLGTRVLVRRLLHPVTSTLASRCGLFPVCSRLRACRSGLGTGQSFGQKSYLAGVVRFVFANVEPFPIDVYLVAAAELLCIGR
jgi:hypothetical protein